MPAPSALLRLRENGRRWRNCQQCCPGVFFIREAGGVFREIGPGFDLMTGLKPQAVLADPEKFRALILEEDRERAGREEKDRAGPGGPFTLRYRLRHAATGAIVHLRDSRVALPPFGGRRTYQGLWMDETPAAMASRWLKNTVWKENLSAITAGLIHDFSNMMTGIYSLGELYYSDLSENHPWRQGMGQIKENALKARKLVRRMMDLQREESGISGCHNVTRLIREQADLIPHLLPEGCQWEMDLPEEELPVNLDDVCFRRMLLNLAMQACNGPEKKGRARLAARRAERGEAIFGGPWAAPRRGALISFTFSGWAAAPEQLEHIFDPYFSTDENCPHAGLGLHQAKSFAESAEGRLGAASLPDEGTVLWAYLPLADYSDAYQETAAEPVSLLPPRFPRLAVYTARNPAGPGFLNLLRERGFRVGIFKKPEEFKNYFKETNILPNLVLFAAEGEDPAAKELSSWLAGNYPGIPRAAHFAGRRAGPFPRRLNVHLAADERMLPAQIAARLHALIR